MRGFRSLFNSSTLSSFGATKSPGEHEPDAVESFRHEAGAAEEAAPQAAAPRLLELAMARPREWDGGRGGRKGVAGLDGDAEDARGAGSVPPWREHLTARGMVASLAVGAMYCIIVMKLNLATRLVPTLNVSSTPIAFVLLRCWTQALDRLGVATRPFTRQENTVVQTCAVACYTIAIGGGFSSYLLALNKRTYEFVGEETEGNVPGSYKEPGIAWITGFLLAVSFVGIFSLIPLRKIMIIDYKLPYPSGTATAVLINGFHTTQGDAISNKWMGSQHTLQSASCGASSSGFTQVETIAGSHNFPFLD